MLTASDFAKKQIVFVFFNEGEKLAFSNDNMVIKTADGKIKMQCTCYRLFLVFVVGNTSITTEIIRRAQIFGFYIALMTSGFKLYALIGDGKDSNTLLKKKQYAYEGIDIAKIIVSNKINNQLAVLKNVRNKNDSIKEAIFDIRGYLSKISGVGTLNELMAYEGLSSKLYFRNHFNNVLWQGRQPRIKRDYINSALDIGYTVLFTFIDTLLLSCGFDTYCGVLHRQFYKRKSLVCDIVEPFRPLIDKELKKAINLNIVKEGDFTIINYQYRVKWSESSKYVKTFMTPLLKNKTAIFEYVNKYYIAFMKSRPPEEFPIFDITGCINDYSEL